MQRIPTRLNQLLMAALLGACALAPAHGMNARTGLKLAFEVRDHIHKYYVETVDSGMVIDAALDGLVASLPAGENVYISPDEMASLDSDPGDVPDLDDRQQLQLLGEVFQAVSRDYVTRVGVDTLSRGLVWGMLTALDPHSSYLDPDDYDEMVERFRGNFEGIGIYFEVRKGKLLVIAPIVGSPSYGKLRAGDHIAEIEGVSTEGITSEQVMKKLRGPKGSDVEVTVRRQGRSEPFGVNIRRDRIKVHSVPYVFMLRPGLGYIRVARFAETTGDELGKALVRLSKQGMKRLLLDLRGNGGGLLSQAVDVADYFLEPDQLVVYTEGRTPDSRREYRADRVPGLPDLPIVVLIDHGSASASEIVAGALQDLDKALIVGQTSFGKGLVQEQFPLRSNGGLLLLTVARYYTPLGRLIQRPYSDDLQAYYQDGTDDFDPNAVDSLRVTQAVFHTELGRPVYGGGGITPDVVLPDDTYPDFMYEAYGAGALADFSSRWAGSQGELPSTFARYQQSFTVPQEALVGFRAHLDSLGINADADSFRETEQMLRLELKAAIAQVLWGDEQRYRVRIEGSQMVRAAMELFPEAEDLINGRRTGPGEGY
jgi:carboxyl-terminal processing protease